MNFSQRARRVFLIIHLWTGLALGAWFALVGLTGSVVAWRSEISAAEWRSQFPIKQPRPETKIIPVSQALTAIQAANPDVPPTSFASLRVPRADLPFYAFPLRGQDGIFRIAAVDPFTGVAHSPRQIPSLISLIEELHTALLLKDAGNTVNGVLSLLAVPLLVSGVWLWWPKTVKVLKMRLTVKRGTSLQRFLNDLHSVMGIYLSPIVLVTVVTAAYLVGNKLIENQRRSAMASVATPREAQGRRAAQSGNGDTGIGRPRQGPRGGSRAAVAGGPRGRYTGPLVTPSANGQTVSVDTLVATAAQAVPNQELVEVRLPAAPDQAMRVMYRRDLGLTKYGLLYLDPYTGSIVERTRTYNSEQGSSLTQISEGLHYGAYGGSASKLVYTFAGLIPLGLFITGTWMWIKKKLFKRNKHTKQ